MTAILISQMAVLSAAAQPAPGPASRPAEVRAERDFSAQMAKLDAEYRSKKLEVLKRYVAQLAFVKSLEVRSGDPAEAQRLFDSINYVNAKIAELDPPRPAGEAAFAFSLVMSEAMHQNVVNVSLTDIAILDKSIDNPVQNVVWQAKLAADQQERLTKFLRTFPLAQLRDSYANSNVNDGYFVTFIIQLGDTPTRTITVSNARQRDLERLVEEINDLIPPKFIMTKLH
jgi:hypothetical protein